MKNQQLQIIEFGAPSVLALAQSELTALSEGDVLVKVAFAGVNPVDAKTRAGLGWAAERCKDALPWTPGFDFSGEIVAVGEGVSQKWQEGARVAGLTLDGGCYAEYLVIKEDKLVEVPENISLKEAAATPLAALTALQALQKGGLSEDDRVLILAGAGGVGHFAIQFANEHGAQVYASCSSKNVAFVQALGANALDYTQGDLDIDGVDLLIDLVGGHVGEKALGCVKKGGRVVTIPSVTAASIIEHAEKLGLAASGMLVEPDNELCSEIFRMLANEAVTVTVSEQFALSEGDEAHTAIETGRTRGKLVLAIAGA
ncbi:NADP-dependent oxidoreductase [Thaumasiovibrio subtropicus]|uniref:NADP-dependent oxidoreductase n=1 Tax=Thaumasiovibrio subtropicus TaxID=1891207 RepID=UPI000B35A886|nr:NADP-dependent oxidoreductase [Thaumasiovibrio subtropicus]